MNIIEAIDAWNTCPIEDALQARIAELEKEKEASSEDADEGVFQEDTNGENKD